MQIPILVETPSLVWGTPIWRFPFWIRHKIRPPTPQMEPKALERGLPHLKYEIPCIENKCLCPSLGETPAWWLLALKGRPKGTQPFWGFPCFETTPTYPQIALRTLCRDRCIGCASFSASTQQACAGRGVERSLSSESTRARVSQRNLRTI